MMLVQQKMESAVKYCSPEDSLADAARVLWEHDCGCAPVLDDGGHLRGILTDRDICMAAYTSGRGLQELKVADVMAEDVATVGPQESVRDAEKVMRARGVRRLPVLDEERRVVGVLSCNDLCRWVDDGGANGDRDHDATHLVGTLATIGKPRGPAAVGSPASEAPTVLELAAPLEAPTIRQRGSAQARG